MSSVEFDEGNNFTYKSRVILGAPTTPRMVNWIVNTGLLKSKGSAKKFLLAVAISAFLASSFVFVYFVLGVGRTTTPDPNMMVNIE